MLMEAQVMKALRYNLAVVTPLHLLRHLLELAEASSIEQNYAVFLLEVAHQNYQLLTNEPPLVVAAAALHLARHTLHQGKYRLVY